MKVFTDAVGQCPSLCCPQSLLCRLTRRAQVDCGYPFPLPPVVRPSRVPPSGHVKKHRGQVLLLSSLVSLVPRPSDSQTPLSASSSGDVRLCAVVICGWSRGDLSPPIHSAHQSGAALREHHTAVRQVEEKPAVVTMHSGSSCQGTSAGTAFAVGTG